MVRPVTTGPTRGRRRHEPAPPVERIDVRLGGAEVTLVGNVVTVDAGDPIDLSDTEARLLRALASRPDVVFAKADLLAIVWGDRSTDPHVVEVAIGRLRHRLGDHGDSIASVYRRGYALRTLGA